MTSLVDLTGDAMALAVANGEISAQETVEACLKLIDATDNRLNAWVRWDGEFALAQAEQADRERAIRGPLGPLDGVPVAVKDVIDVAGLPTQAGFAPFADRVATADSWVVQRLRLAGAIPLGKVSTAQFAVSDPPPTISPWNPRLTPGGSSTGSGVAVAVRHVPLALGTQTGGSILRPAAFNGVVGFKPTYGRVPTHGVIPTAPSLDHVGILTRSVADCASFLHAVTEKDSMPDQGRERLTAWAPRLGVVVEALDSAEEGVRTPVRAALDSLADAGAVVTEVDIEPSLSTFHGLYRVIMQSEASNVHAELFGLERESYGPLLRAYLEVGRLIPAWILARAQDLRGELRRSLVILLRDHQLDALALPATPTLPPPRESTGSSAFLSPFSLVGSPAISLPCGVSGGLPQSLQLATIPGKDRDLLEIAAWCERILGTSPAPPFPK